MSNGRSIRGRVGFDRSGSTNHRLASNPQCPERAVLFYSHTDQISICVSVLNRADRLNRRLLKSGSSYSEVSGPLSQALVDGTFVQKTELKEPPSPGRLTRLQFVHSQRRVCLGCHPPRTLFLCGLGQINLAAGITAFIAPEAEDGFRPWPLCSFGRHCEG